ncbi:hypothetical protein C5E23_13625 [Pectobacterium parmentieri]|nr:hypothetical protein C5E25_13655 [Pectobacterium parmentieri]AYH15135.1 hypothetical protein C5E23_13625 [Pectobacterium parmentieri]AYH23835.1 hypothetical protein C5E21_13615 [Pectobacterium parmentieri]
MILNEPIIIEHHISELNVDSCITEVMIVCIADSEKYSAGDVLMCPAGLISIAGASRSLPLTAGVSKTHIQFNAPIVVFLVVINCQAVGLLSAHKMN